LGEITLVIPGEKRGKETGDAERVTLLLNNPFRIGCGNTNSWKSLGQTREGQEMNSGGGGKGKEGQKKKKTVGGSIKQSVRKNVFGRVGGKSKRNQVKRPRARPKMKNRRNGHSNERALHHRDHLYTVGPGVELSGRRRNKGQASEFLVEHQYHGQKGASLFSMSDTRN